MQEHVLMRDWVPLGRERLLLLCTDCRNTDASVSANA